MCLGCSRVRESPCRVAGLEFRTKRTTASEPANNGPRSRPRLPTPQTQTTPIDQTANHPHWPGLGGSAPRGPPRFIALAPIPENRNRNGTSREYDSGAPSPVLAPGAALGSRLRVALSSGQVTGHSICDSNAEPLAVRAVCAANGSRWSPSMLYHPALSTNRIWSPRGRARNRIACFGRVIRDPGRSFSRQPLIFAGNLRNLRSRTTPRSWRSVRRPTAPAP